MSTMYDENERILGLKQLSNFGLNPFAIKILIESYHKMVAPLPIRLLYEMPFKDPLMDHRGRDYQVELTIATPGNSGTRWGNPALLDKFAVNMSCISYYEQLRPLPFSFVFRGFFYEIHFRTPGQAEYDRKNPARGLFNPLAEKSSKKLDI